MGDLISELMVVLYTAVMALPFVIAGAVWRIVDGNGYGPTWVRSAVLGLLCVVAFAAVGTPVDVLGWTVAVVVAGFASWAMLLGSEDWTSWRTLYRYWPAAIGGLVATVYSANLVAGLTYLGLLLVAGAAHPTVTRLNVHTRYAEGVIGACVIGGLVIL